MKNTKKKRLAAIDNDFLIIIKSKQAEKVKKILEKEKISYEIPSKSKVFSREKDIKEVMKSFDRARIKVKCISWRKK